MEENERRNDKCELQTEPVGLMIPTIKSDVCSIIEDYSKPTEEVKIGELQSTCDTEMKQNKTRNDKRELITDLEMIPTIKTEVCSDNEECSDSIKPLEEINYGGVQGMCYTEIKEEFREEVLEIDDIPSANRTYFKEEFLTKDEEVVHQNTIYVPDYDPLAPKCKVEDSQEVSHSVFIKEESEHQLENNTFGNHFMTFVEPQDQCSSGQPAVPEQPCCQHSLEKAARSNSDGPVFDEDGLIIYRPVRWIDGGPTRCPKIKRICPRAKNYKKKIKTAQCQCGHGGELVEKGNHKPIQCEYCPYTSKTYTLMKSHTSKIHNVELLDCPFCKYQDLSLAALQGHIDKRHCVPKPIRPLYLCPHCNCKFRSSMGFEGHIAKKHTHEVRFRCGFCNFKCWYKKEIKSHYQKH